MIPSVKTMLVLFCAPFLFLNLEARLLDNAASLGGAPVGIYSRHGGIFGDSDNLASLGGAPVGVYRKQQNPVLLYPFRVPEVFPSRFAVHRRPLRPRPRPTVRPKPRPLISPRPSPVKPGGVTGRFFGGLLSGLF